MALLPFAGQINFFQNDAWCYYLTVETFLKGIYVLHPYMDPIFYLQGFMGMFFAKLFGIVHLPVLTVLVACASCYLFMLIMKEFFNLSVKTTCLLGLIYILNPLGVYEFWGFMNNHYFSLFLLVALYFFLKFEKTSNKLHFILYMFFNFLSLLVRQTALVLPLSASVYYFYKKNLKLSLINLGYFLCLYITYAKIIPLTPRILESPLHPEFILRNDYVFALIYGTLIMLAAFMLPLIINVINIPKITSNKRSFLKFGFVFVLVFIALSYLYKPMSIANGEFPYFENVFERTGFYPSGIQGTKYHFIGNFVMWKYWDLVSKIGIASFVTYILLNLKNKMNIFIVYIGVYLVIMIATQKYYDRYIFTIVPFSCFYLISIKDTFTRLMSLCIVVFIVFLGFLAYQFSADFLLVNKYVWTKSQELVVSREIRPELVMGTNAWKLTYKNFERNYLYFFSYDSPSVNSDYKDNYNLLESYTPTYPLNFFVNPKIYLYEKKNY